MRKKKKKKNQFNRFGCSTVTFTFHTSKYSLRIKKKKKKCTNSCNKKGSMLPTIISFVHQNKIPRYKPKTFSTSIHSSNLVPFISKIPADPNDPYDPKYKRIFDHSFINRNQPDQRAATLAIRISFHKTSSPFYFFPPPLSRLIGRVVAPHGEARQGVCKGMYPVGGLHLR